VDYLRTNDFPPEEVSDAAVKTGGSVGFSGAVMPLLSTMGEVRSLATQHRRLQQEFNVSSRLYGAQGRYYDQCLLLFASGWGESRFRFDSGGELIVSWKQEQ
jgi:endo-1,4-beta-D-glucanase Y